MTEIRRALARLRHDVAMRLGRLPLRVRLTLSFAGVMVVLFGVIALLLYFTFEAGLDASINNSLNSRSYDLTLIVAKTPSAPLGSNAQIVDTATYRVACLLYTSPSPRDRQKSRMPSSA